MKVCVLASGSAGNSVYVQEGATQYRRSELATHYVAGVERRLGRGHQVRVEGYCKMLLYPPDWWDNRDYIDLTPELAGSRLHLFPATGSVRGIEVYVRRDTRDRLSWWASYTCSVGRERHDETFSLPELGQVISTWSFISAILVPPTRLDCIDAEPGSCRRLPNSIISRKSRGLRDTCRAFSMFRT